MRIISLGGVAAAALAVGLPMIPAEAQTSVIPAGYSAPAQVSRPQPVHADPAMSLSAGPLALGIAGQFASAREATAKYATNLAKAKEATCPTRAPHTGAKFTFWHSDLITMHVWVWYPNPAGLFSSTNPLVAPFNRA
jgi:hypothetical protein